MVPDDLTIDIRRGTITLRRGDRTVGVSYSQLFADGPRSFGFFWAALAPALEQLDLEMWLDVADYAVYPDEEGS